MRAIGRYPGRIAVVALLLSILAGASWAAPLLKDEEQRLREQAVKLNEVTGDDPIAGQIVTLIEEKENTKKLLAVAHKMAKEKEKDKDPVFNINATWILARTAARLKETETAEYFYRQQAAQALKLESSQKFVRANSGLLDMLYANKRYGDAEKLCKEMLEMRAEDDNMQLFKLAVLRLMVRTQAKQGKFEQALKMVNNLIKAGREDWRPRELKAWVLREDNKLDESAKTYEDVLERINQDDNLRKPIRELLSNEIRYTLSGVYIDMKKIDKASEHLEVLMKKDKDNPTYKNDLGFIWADNDMKLDEAEKLIRQAIDDDRKLRKKEEVQPSEDKDNAAYLDSLGWVLYKKKKYKEALEPLQDAVKQEEGQHLEIYDHLADVYIAMEQPEKAIAAWKKGLTCESLGKRDEKRKLEVEKKIKQYEKK
jgi:tetratricopeptide (TPR) repeat protein